MQIWKRFFVIVIALCLLNSCVLPPLSCVLEFEGLEKKYKFKISKDELKDKIVEAYSYDVSLGSKLLGAYLIEETLVNKKYRYSADVWLDRKSWDEFKSEVRDETQDTLNIIIGKHLSRKELCFRVIIEGDTTSSSLTIQKVGYQQAKSCKRDLEHYESKFSNRIENKFVDKLN